MIKEKIDQFAARFAIPIALGAAALIVVAGITATPNKQWQDMPLPFEDVDIAPKGGAELPVVWGDLGRKLVEVGAIDREKWIGLYGTLTGEEELLLEGSTPEKLRITRENAGYLLNLLWAFGLANKNPILRDETAMANPEYGGTGGFASTGGWTLSGGNPMDHYGRHDLVSLTKEQQALVKKISDGIYRPCCDNPTSFPDCNHGMAMLGLLELMASQGVPEEEMWRAALAVNSYWFPGTYATVAQYKKRQGVAWKDVDPREVLGYDYSSATGFSRIASEISGGWRGGPSCSV